MEFASKGVAGAGLGLGIAGTALGLLNGSGNGLAGILNGGCNANAATMAAVAAGMTGIAANAGQMIEQYAGPLGMLGIFKDGQIDVEGLAAELKRQMQSSGGALSVPIGSDVFTFFYKS